MVDCGRDTVALLEKYLADIILSMSDKEKVSWENVPMRYEWCSIFAPASNFKFFRKFLILF